MTVTSFRCLALVACLATCQLALAGCKSPGSADKRQQPVDPTDEASDELPFDIDPLVEQVETLRDRSFKQEPSARPHDGPIDHRAEISPEARRERSRLAEVLFGLQLQEQPRSSKPERLATYRPEANRIDVATSAGTRAELKTAVRMALVSALDHQHFGSSSDASTWDGALAERAARIGDRVFVAALADKPDRLSAAELAARPEVVGRLNPLEQWLDIGGGDSPSMIQTAEALDHRLSAFTLREGLSLAAAFHRGSGWSGVELLFSRDPDSTRDVVSPNRWIDGEGLGTWSWPDSGTNTDWPVVADGRVGPALTATWVAQTVPPKLARTIYTGWTSDAYRLRRADGDSTRWQFEWLTHWSTPHGARQIAAAFERIIKEERKDGRPDLSGTVVRRGLKVSLVFRRGGQPTTTEDGSKDDAEGESEQEGGLQKLATRLLEAGIRFQPRRRLPIGFVPTRRQTYESEMNKAKLTDSSWSDPASGLEVDLSPLSDWKVLRSQTSPLRWFARGPKGTLLQVSTELTDPLGPDFGSDAYLTSWRSGFESSLEKASLSDTERLQEPVDPTLSFSMEGKREGQSIRLKLWHFLRDDVLVTVSLQGPRGTFGEVEPAATSVLSGIELDESQDQPADGASDNDDGGSIEYELNSE